MRTKPLWMPFNDNTDRRARLGIDFSVEKRKDITGAIISFSFSAAIELRQEKQ